MDKYINLLFQDKTFITLNDIKEKLIDLKSIAASIAHTNAKGTRSIREKAKCIRHKKDALVLLRRILRYKNKALIYQRKNRKVGKKWKIEYQYRICV